MNEFFKIKGAYKRGAAFVDIDFEYDEYEAFLDMNILMNCKTNFKISKGKKMFDVIQLEYDGFNFLMSEKFKDILVKNEITGFDFGEVNIEKLKEKYYLFHVNGQAGEILNKKELMNLETKNREFDVNSWDGSDLFNLKDSAVIACTKKVKDIIESEKITNHEIEPL